MTDRDLHFLFFFVFVRSNFVLVQFADDAMFAFFVTNAEKIIFSTIITFDNIFAHFIYVPVLLTVEALRRFIFFIKIFANFKFVIFYNIFLMRRFVVFEKFTSIISEKKVFLISMIFLSQTIFMIFRFLWIFTFWVVRSFMI